MNKLLIPLILVIISSCTSDVSTEGEIEKDKSDPNAFKKEMNFSNSEWTSDSLYPNKENHWREYLYFDSLGGFLRASRDGESYVLDEGHYSDGLINSAKTKYRVDILDSFHIKIYNEDYTGFFHGNPWQRTYDFDGSKKAFIDGDRDKKILLGKWIFNKAVLDVDEDFKRSMHKEELTKLYDKVFYKVAQRKVNESMYLHFKKDNSLISDNYEMGAKRFRYSLDGSRMDVNGSDYVFYIDYEIIDENTLVIENSFEHVGKAKLYFKKDK